MRLRSASAGSLHLVRMSRGRTRTLGPDARPIAVPDDVDAPGQVKAEGVVTLPTHVRWSGESKTYDLSNEQDRARVYEQVLREGTDDDVRAFIDVDELAEMWSALVLPPRVRRAWAGWFRRHRDLDLPC